MSAQRGRRLALGFPPVVAVLVAVTIVKQFGPAHAELLLGPLFAATLVLLGRRAGRDDLGLARRSWRRGVAYGAGAVALMAVMYAVGVALPQTRTFFLDVRYRLPVDSALVTALVVIPLRTVLVEEIAFRGVLFGLFRHWGAARATIVSSAVFGLWHVLPSLHLGRANHAVASAVGSGDSATVAVVAGGVVFTALAGILFCELRRRSGSLLASLGLHWATNGLAVVLAAMVWKMPVT